LCESVIAAPTGGIEDERLQIVQWWWKREP
jgi:hypothetical protein